ncbi:MAG: hypothetical protein GXP47_03155 [Acidobacteria bacterium]|nr:hypothetical protein [Acidobacteriota bacterium]
MNRALRIAGTRWSVLLALALVPLNLAWSPETTREVAWRAVEFFPPDLARQVRKNHELYDRGIREGLSAPPAWRAGPPGRLQQALADQAGRCARDLRRPVPLGELVRELGVLAVRVADANDPLAVAHADAREPAYGAAYESYVDSILGRLRIVYYGRDRRLGRHEDLMAFAAATMNRSRSFYTLVGEEFYRTGRLRSWKTFDDLSVTFGVAGVCLSHAMTDLANLADWIWQLGGGMVPTPRPTPAGHVGPTITVGLGGGFPERRRPPKGKPAMPRSSIQLPPP